LNGVAWSMLAKLRTTNDERRPWPPL